MDNLHFYSCTNSVPYDINQITAKLKVEQIQSDTKKRELLKNPTKIEEIQEKKLLTEIEPLQLAF